jgi:Na+/proline symporter
MARSTRPARLSSIATPHGAVPTTTVVTVDVAPAGIIGRNIVGYIKPGISEEYQLKWCRWSILIVAVLSLVLALYFQNIYKLCMHSWGILLVGGAAPMIAGLYWRRTTTPGAVAGTFCGIVSLILLSRFMEDGIPAHLCGFGISVAALVVVSLLTRQAK